MEMENIFLFHYQVIRHPSDLSHNSGYAGLGMRIVFRKPEEHILATTFVGSV